MNRFDQSIRERVLLQAAMVLKIFLIGTAGLVGILGPSQAAPQRRPISISRTSQSTSIANMERQLWSQVNRQRQRYGLRPLRSNPRLNQIARTYSRQMANYNFYRHRGLWGETPRQRVEAQGLRARLVGENLVKFSLRPNPTTVAVQSWMRSPGHRRTLLLPQMTDTGIGVWKKGANYFFTQLYVQPQR
jgi:uncharacterized protein YkwD